MDKEKVLFITGIDTGIGKTCATAYYATLLRGRGFRVVTQKPVETGCTGESQDLATHDTLATNSEGYAKAAPFRCSYLLPFPASPHLSARLEGVEIAPEKIDKDTASLLALGFDRVLMEGAGGLMVPLTDRLLTIDFIMERGYPIGLVTSGRLGSINHTLLSLEAIERRGLRLSALLYNHFARGKAEIEEETRSFLKRHLLRHHAGAEWIDIPLI